MSNLSNIKITFCSKVSPLIICSSFSLFSVDFVLLNSLYKSWRLLFSNFFSKLEFFLSILSFDLSTRWSLFFFITFLLILYLFWFLFPLFFDLSIVFALYFLVLSLFLLILIASFISSSKSFSPSSKTIFTISIFSFFLFSFFLIKLFLSFSVSIILTLFVFIVLNSIVFEFFDVKLLILFFIGFIWIFFFLFVSWLITFIFSPDLSLILLSFSFKLFVLLAFFMISLKFLIAFNLSNFVLNFLRILLFLSRFECLLISVFSKFFWFTFSSILLILTIVFLFCSELIIFPVVKFETVLDIFWILFVLLFSLFLSWLIISSL